jgi:hypothetical protein
MLKNKVKDVGQENSAICKGTNFNVKQEGQKLFRDKQRLELYGCPVSRQTISAFVKHSNNEQTDLKPAVKERKCKRVLKMEHFEYVDNEMAKNNEQ